MSETIPRGAPTDLSVDSATHDGVALSWSAPDHNGLTGYRILRGDSPDTLETLVEDTGDLALTYTDTTAADDATHHYAVVALSLDGDSPQSATVSATTPPQPTPTPEPTPEPPQDPLRGGWRSSRRGGGAVGVRRAAGGRYVRA